MAAGLMRQRAGDSVTVDSAGTHPGVGLNGLSVESLAELGIQIGDQRPKVVTAQMVSSADLVVVPGSDAHVEAVDSTPVETWEIDEPSLHGIEGIERMRLLRDDIAEQVESLRIRLDLAPGRRT